MARHNVDFSKFYEILPMDGTGDSVIVYRGNGGPQITGGGGRWDVVQRPRRKSVTMWRGSDPYTMDVPILFDGWELEISQEVLIARINQLRFSQKELQEPPQLRINGALPVKGATWILSDITWGNAIWNPRLAGQSHRFRQDATLHLLQYVSEEAFKNVKEFEIRDKIVVTKHGQGIEHHSGGDHKTKKEIQKKNGIRDPKVVKKNPGKHVKVPYRKNLKKINENVAGKAYGQGVLQKIG